MTRLASATSKGTPSSAKMINTRARCWSVGRKHDLVSGGRIRQVEYLNVTVGRSDDEKRILNIHGIAPFWQLDGRDRAGGPQVPILTITKREKRGRGSALGITAKKHTHTHTP